MIRRGRTLIAGAVVASLLSVILAGCGDDDSSSSSKPPVNIANKGFTESNIIAEAYKQALESAGFTVTLKPLTSTAIADAAIQKGDIDIYPDYTTTLLTDVLKVTSPPTDVNEQVAAIKSGYASRGLTVLDVAPFNNDNEVACTKDAVAQYSLTDLSSLGRASGNIVYSANPEHTTRADGLPLLERGDSHAGGGSRSTVVQPRGPWSHPDRVRRTPAGSCRPAPEGAKPSTRRPRRSGGGTAG